MDRTDCFVVRQNRHGERATYSKFAFAAGETVYTVRGDAAPHRTRDTIEIGPGQHVEDPYALFLNHSFAPNLAVRGRALVALAGIAPGDELTFNYLASESAIAAAFTCHESGRPVNSDGCKPHHVRSPSTNPRP